MSERGYAVHAGISRPAVAAARMLGRLVHYADGSIDAAASDKRRAEMTDPSKQRGRQSMRQVPEAAVAAVSETLAEAGDGMSYLEARTANEVLKVEQQKIRLRKLEASLIDRRKATALVLALAHQTRDSWLGWPARVAAEMAAELGVDAHALQKLLETLVRQHVTEMGEVKVDLR
ncbi:MAG: elements of external origin [Rhodospirillales bacterium]